MPDREALLRMQQDLIDEFPDVAVRLVKSADGPTLAVSQQGRAEVFLSYKDGRWALFHASPRVYFEPERIYPQLQRELNKTR